MSKHESYHKSAGVPESRHQHKDGRKGVAPKTASPHSGHSDGGGSEEVCDAAKGLNSGHGKGGLPAQ